MESFFSQRLPSGDGIARILRAALQAVDPAAAVRRFLDRQVDALNVVGQVYDLAQFQHVWVVGAGKAGARMACAVAEILGERLNGGVVIVKDGYLEPCEGFKPSQGLRIYEASHPLPG